MASLLQPLADRLRLPHSVLLAAVLRFDFRADLDAIDTLKSLPLSPSAIAAGQLVAPTLVMTLLHWVVIAATLAATAGRAGADQLRSPMLVAAAVAPARRVGRVDTVALPHGRPGSVRT